ncbi:MAG: DUF1330 domain-containing protein [Anaerolineae bacterium]|nr:DUF1330 domain-containing protein [Anaerolineae bacterium]
MTAFFLAEIEVITDADRYREYRQQAAPIIEKYQGTYVFRSDNITPVSGDWEARRIVLLSFPNVDTLRACFQSEEYKKIAPLREQSTKSKSIIIED